MSMLPVEAGQLWVSYYTDDRGTKKVGSEEAIDKIDANDYWQCFERNPHEETARDIWWSPGAGSLFERVA